MRLVVSDFITLDGVIEAPGFEEHRDGRNGWALRVKDDDLQAYNREQAFAAEALLFGRTTYLMWAAFWPTGPDAEGMRELLTQLPKYVFSRTMGDPDWGNTTVLRGDLGEEVRQLKAQPGGDLVVYGSADLVHGLLELDLVDELRLLVFPLILGSGKRLFRDGLDTRYLRFVSSRTFPSGAVQLTYVREGAPPGDVAAGAAFRWTDEQVQSLQAALDTDRVLATVLFTDIVDSTSRAAALGDREWRRLLDRHDDAAATEVSRWNGQLVKQLGDGVLARFDSPTRALRCAFALRTAIGKLGLAMRAAIHSGEVEVRGSDLGGIAVHIASRVLAIASADEVVVTHTVRDLATGSDLEFRRLRTAALPGVPGRWDLFSTSLR
jgi:class 3 adenylate cyclase/dihydrofolate reductase